MAKRAGRVRCGACNGLLLGAGTKGLQAWERGKLAALPADPREALGVPGATWDVATPLAEMEAWVRNERRHRRPGFIAGVSCGRCHITYNGAELLPRWREAVTRGEDLVLTDADRC